MKIDWKLDSKVATFKVCKYTSFGGSLRDGCFCLYQAVEWQPAKYHFLVCYCLIESVNISPTDHQSQVIKGCPLGGSPKPEAYTNSFLGNTSDLQQGRERMQRWHLPVLPVSREPCSWFLSLKMLALVFCLYCVLEG